MTDRDRTYLERISNEIAFIAEITQKITEKYFMTDSLIQHAVCMSLITIGECANHLSEGFVEAHTDMEWLQIIGVRNIAAHGYWQLDMRQIWQSLSEDIPELQKFVAKHL